MKMTDFITIGLLIAASIILAIGLHYGVPERWMKLSGSLDNNLPIYLCIIALIIIVVVFIVILISIL